jgi:phospholipid N-methyltransferase
MSALFFKRFLQRPFQIASIMPSSIHHAELEGARETSGAEDGF